MNGLICKPSISSSADGCKRAASEWFSRAIVGTKRHPSGSDIVRGPRALANAALLALYVLVVTTPEHAQILAAHVSATASDGNWSYAVYNDEPLGSTNYIALFDLTVDAPITVLNSPPGWNAVTDGTSYVQWYNADPAPPFTHDVAPGSSLGGFSLSSPGAASVELPFGLAAWDHSTDAPGSSVSGATMSPSLGAFAVPESGPSEWVLAMGLGWWWRRKGQKRSAAKGPTAAVGRN